MLAKSSSPKRIEDIHHQLIAFYPIYTDQGNVTRVIYQEPGAAATSSFVDQRQVESVKRALARCYAVDLTAQANLLRERYRRRILLHFYLPDGRVFIPFKLRESRITGDASYGYIELDYVARLVPGDKSYVKLKSGDGLPLFSNITTARLAYFMGLEIMADYTGPRQYEDLDFVNALAVLRKVFAGEAQPEQNPSRRFRVKFLPIK